MELFTQARLERTDVEIAIVLRADAIHGLVDEWLCLNSESEITRTLGTAYLCPAVVMEEGKELRRVGVEVHCDGKDRQAQLAEWVRQCNEDPDIARLLAARTE